jgi:carbon-monoxide dehydrogenase large subunit
MAGEMPDIVISHVQSPTKSSQLGAKGAGEAGTAGAPAAVMNAINDALAPFRARLASQPITPEKVLRALGKIQPAGAAADRGMGLFGGTQSA